MNTESELQARFVLVNKTCDLRKKFQDGTASPLDTITLASHYEEVAYKMNWEAVGMLCRDMIDEASDKLFA